jgi:NAD-dependent deacetylase
MLPTKTWDDAVQHCQAADLAMVVGSSLEVYPANSLPTMALENGAKLVILNLGPTYLDHQADARIADNVALILPRIYAAMQ